jgi:hypothetical protein
MVEVLDKNIQNDEHTASMMAVYRERELETRSLIYKRPRLGKVSLSITDRKALFSLPTFIYIIYIFFLDASTYIKYIQHSRMYSTHSNRRISKCIKNSIQFLRICYLGYIDR